MLAGAALGVRLGLGVVLGGGEVREEGAQVLRGVLAALVDGGQVEGLQAARIHVA